MTHQLKNGLLSAIAEEKIHTSFSCPGCWKDGQWKVIDATCIGAVFDYSARRLKCYTSFGEFRGQGSHEIKDAAVCTVMLTKGLKIPAEEDEISPGIGDPLSIGVRVQWIP